MSDGQKPEDRCLAHQQNKCLNEKRRREQENVYIEELAELISASVTDMHTLSVKPDKCAILQETVNQIRRIKHQESGSSEAVQQSQVSSSKPSIIANDVLGPLLLEALDGFLFVVNSHGKVEFVSENVTSYLKYSLNDLVEKSIYNIIHVGDHAQFSNSLLPMSLAHTGSSSNNFSGDHGLPSTAEVLGKGRTFNCRMLIKPPCEADGDVEVKQTYVSKYENMQISAVLQPYPDKQDNSTEGKSCLVCIARRLPLAEKTMLGIEQFTTKQDLNGKIVDCYTRGITPSQYDYPDFKGHNLQDFCHVNDLQLLAKHIQEVKKNSRGTSSVYRFKLLENRYVFVRTQSQLFSIQSNQQDYIISNHSIIRECDSDAELKGSASTSLMKSIIGPSSSSQNKQSVNSALQGMGLLGTRNLNAYQSSLGATASTASGMPPLGGNASIPDMFNLNDVFDLLPQNFFTSAETLNVSANSVNYSLAGTTNSMTSPAVSAHSSWANSAGLKSPVSHGQQQPIQRSVSLAQNSSISSQQRQMSSNLQRSASLFDQAQKTPNFGGNARPGNCSPSFAIPSPRGYGSYHSQRSPGNSTPQDGNRVPGQFSPLSYPQAKSTSPLMSPQPGGNWSRPPSVGSMDFHHSSQNPLQALQSMDTNHSPGAFNTAQSPLGTHRDKQFVYPGGRVDGRRSSVDKKVNQSAKLTQLLTQNNPPVPGKPFCKALEEADCPFVGELEDASSKLALIRNSLSSDFGDSRQQSPQPGPGTSPPEKPQSTSGNDESDGAVKSNEGSTKKKDENKILKQLLSQDDDLEEEDKTNMSQSDQNEAEPKKTNNALLKKLLNETQLGDQKSHVNEKLQKMLQEEIRNLDDAFQLDRSMSAPVESTSFDVENFNKVSTTEDSSRQRHQSGPQQPTSSTHPGLPYATKNDSTGLNVINQNGTASAMFKNSLDSIVDPQHFNSLMTRLWEKNDSDDALDFPPVRNKRKLPMDVDSTDDIDMEPSTSCGPQKNSKTKKNVLLAKLLEKKSPQETVVNTNITVNPTATPQSKLHNSSTNLHKLVHVLDKLDDEEEQEREKFRNPRDNPRTNPNVPFPGNTNPTSQAEQQVMASGQDRFMSNMPESTSAIRQGLATLRSEQLKRQQELNVRRTAMAKNNGDSGLTSTPVSMEVDGRNQASTTEPPDLLLAQILQQAQELQNDISTGSLSNSLDKALGNVTDDSTLWSQLDLVLKDSNLSMSEFDNLLGISSQTSGATGPQDLSEQMAISAIQKQLMSDSVASPAPNSMPPTPNSVPLSSPSNSMAQQPQRMPNSNEAFAHVLMQQQQQQQQQHPAPSQLSPLELPFNQQMAPQQPPGYTQQGPRLPQPQGQGGSLGSVSTRPGFAGMSASSMAVQVRQSLLMQQKQKQMREIERRERLRQQKQHQLMLRQQQQAQQFNQFPQRFPQNSMAMDTGGGASFPENLGELMKSGNAPNVTLPRNPMSPRFVGGNQSQQQQSLQNLISSSTPPPQLSPHYNTGGKGAQWAGGRQVNQGMLPSPTLPQNSQFGMRSRQLSGNSLPSPGGQPSGARFPYPSPDTQFNNTQGGQLGMYGQSQQQQALFNQNRLMQRQLSLTGRGSPRTPHSPFGTPGTDAMLMSPRSQSALSPNPALRTQATGSQAGQLSPQFPQTSLPQGFSGQTLPTSYNQTHSPSVTGSLSPHTVNLTNNSYAPSPQGSVGSLTNQPGFHDFDMSIFNNAGLDNKVGGSLGGDLSLGNTPTSSTSQYVKQELRNICNARSEKHLQTQQPQVSPMDVQSSELTGGLDFDSSELPYLLEEIHQITQQGLGQGMEPMREDNVLLKSQQEARLRCEQLRQLSHQGIRQTTPFPAAPVPQQEDPVFSRSEDTDVKATNLFRNQLLSAPSTGQPPQSKASLEPPHHVNVVQNEPRAPCEEMKPADQKNSLLQKLLSSE